MKTTIQNNQENTFRWLDTNPKFDLPHLLMTTVTSLQTKQSTILCHTIANFPVGCIRGYDECIPLYLFFMQQNHTDFPYQQFKVEIAGQGQARSWSLTRSRFRVSN